jgi:tetratricopeptide (TPR) repeat protein
MPKTGRNDPCPCGSGKKYKRCCLAQDQAREQLALAAKRAELQAQGAQHSAKLAHYKAALLQRLQGLQGLQEPDELEQDSNAVIDLIQAGQLDQAERAARELLVRYPEVHDGHDRLGMVYEARGMPHEAAQCYRQVVEFIRANPHNYEPEFEQDFVELIDRLDPSPDAG